MSKQILFYDGSFPYAGERPNAAALARLQEDFRIVNAAELADALQDADVYVHLHGSYFPKAAWPAILAHANQGKGLIAAGGAPFKTPVTGEAGSWKAEPDQTAYHQQIHIHEALPVATEGVAKLAANRDIALFEGYESLFTIQPTFGLVLHVTHADDCPGQQNGSAGPIDAHIYPLLKGISGDGLDRERSAPAVLIEFTKGPFAGSRMIFVNQQLGDAFWSGNGAEALAKWAAFTASGVTELWLKPNYGSYELGERPVLMLQGQQILQTRTERVSSRTAAWTFNIRVLKAVSSEVQQSVPSFDYDNGGFAEIWRTEATLEIGRELVIQRIVTPLDAEAGFYTLECEAVSPTGERRLLRQGFWGMDQALLESGEMITCDRDYFIKNGRPLPIVGMTYMTSDVARKYLFLPNAAVWDRDIAQMKRAGINSIRTGIWTAWRNYMFVDGHPYEEVLRAIDALFLTAKRHDMEVTFNFFAFTPETWEGVNPYLDPRSVEAQKRFIAAIVSRHAQSKHVHWDLINEPSMFDPKRVFSNGPRSAHDSFEHAAYLEWLEARHGSIELLQERWNMTPSELPSFGAVKLPEPGDIAFGTTEVVEKRGGPWLDYTLFTMDMHNRWASQLIDTIRSIQPKQLVTVGQDEGLGAQRPSPFFYAEAVDYTTVHSWWLMDDLVWDGIFAKAPDKPNLIQETGIMYVETPDGRAKRSEEELRNILERKYAYAFSTGGAGAVQWIWNINFYMHNINESHIGAVRADGTEKPEANVSYDFGSFMETIRDLFVDRKLEDVAVIYPYSNDFSNRKLAGEATTRAIRTLSYTMNVHAFGLGEYQLESLATTKPKLIIVPSAHNFSSEALETLTAHIETHGGTLLFTGPLGLDAYWRPVQAKANELGLGAVGNLLREELLELNGKLIPVSFGGTRIADSSKGLPATAEGGPAKLTEVELGAGRLLYCPLPIELNERLKPLKAVYGHALEQAGVETEVEWLHGGDLPGVYGRKLAFASGSLYIFVSEFSCDAAIEIRDPQSGTGYAFTLPQERTVMFAADAQGKLIAVYRPNEVTIDVR
ncbi:glycoside hydrolase [Paenibacillus rhizovicinus]|uniref:Glycoside hydrolase n=1 Tax=Paenibacillus rhizovicinus TaxID=2704463 RepID=A0A6C0NWE6_9BACL|nr:beta-galactosidase [Paenibacillus rhizovicinus]QHW30499.1 glycoside hydrolase [Paenibacillus rhizovicinus]